MVDSLRMSWEQGPMEDYEALPYPSMPFAYTQPARLAALAQLFGLTAPDANAAHVLELGCASGGNIIPLAARFPRARFVGVDLSHRHIEEGRERIRALSLTNVELRQADITRIELGSGQFDYLICHGVFSWVPRQAQDAIFHICNEALVPNGVAVISYNVLPGWYLRTIIRDICQRHVGSSGSPRERVASARRALDLIAGSLQEKNAYGVLLRDEARRLAGRPAAYIMGEFLSVDNSPCYFHEFTDRAKSFGLTFLCEGDLNTSIPEIQDPEIRRRNRLLAGPNHLALEQCIDFFTGRTFRRSILVKSEQSRHIRRDRNVQRLRSLHFAAASMAQLPGDNLTSVRLRKSGVDGTLRCLNNVFPGTLTYDELVSLVQANMPQTTPNSISRVLFSLLSAGQVTASTVASRAGRAIAKKPCVWPVARFEATVKQPWLTNLNHKPVPLKLLPFPLLARLDGSANRNAIRSHIVNALLNGEIDAPVDLRRRTSAQLESAAEHYISRALIELEKQALLEP